MMCNVKKITSLFIVFVIGSMGLFAQAEEVSDTELQQFASALQQVQSVDQDAQQDMVKAVEEEGFEIQRFNEIHQAKLDPNQEADASNEEEVMYEMASKELEKIQVDAQQKMQKKIAEEGLTVTRYQEIMASLQTNPDLQQKLQEILQS